MLGIQNIGISQGTLVNPGLLNMYMHLKTHKVINPFGLNLMAEPDGQPTLSSTNFVVHFCVLSCIGYTVNIVHVVQLQMTFFVLLLNFT